MLRSKIDEILLEREVTIPGVVPTEVRLTRLRPGARVPEYRTPGAAGADLYAHGSVELQPHDPTRVSLGLALAIPDGYEGQIRPRSSMSLRGIEVALGTIDSDYRGEVSVTMTNTTSDYYVIHDGDRIAQLVIAPVVRAAFVEGALDATTRGTGGHGSTGR